ncbi:MAG TPA: MHYT domain-containing protein [Verrucomicrobiae bacterium]|jgi:NO-binding membrane sensor protein with MHYT domain/nitrogen-specific signal transduction histidine kinase|nr:MHYT domain-containing protein [Verrucomicrobiae bacterium]
MAAVNLIGSYNYALVALSVLIAVFASYAALDLAGRVTAAGGWTRAIWLMGGAAAMGTGIWSMHYIGMLAFILPVPVAYHWPTVLLSLLAAILASVVALGVVSRQKMGPLRALAGSVLMGAGISSMHYIGMAAMRLPADCEFNSFLVVLSVVFAVLISLAALWITFHFRDEKNGIGWKKLAGAVVMGAAIPVMHYTGMAAASFTPSDVPADLSHAISISTLSTVGIAAVTFIVLGLAILMSWIDRRFAAQALELQEEKLQQSEVFLSEAQRLSHTGSFAWRVSTGEIVWSEETFRIFQYERTTKPTVELILQRVHPEDTAFVKQTIERASQDGKNFEHEYRLVMPDGPVKHVHVVAHGSQDKSRGIEFVGAVMDVTERKQADEALRQAQAELARVSRLTTMGEFTASLAHEVNQPIAAAVTNANACLRWLARDRPDVEEARDAASRLVKDATRAADIISRTRLLFKKGTLQRELVDVNEVIREIIVLLRSEATRYSVSIRTELAAALPRVMGDSVQLQQVMMNLMINSIEAMKDVDKTRNLAIKSQRAESEQLMVSVSDTGAGLPPQADQIFNAFFTTKVHGTGLGLSISRSIVESHGGRLWAAGNSPRGACFHLTLPTKPEAH